MISRYQTTVMNEIFSDEYKFRTWFIVECAYLRAYMAHNSRHDEALLNRLQQKVKDIDWSSFKDRAFKSEQEVHHDVIAFLHVLEEELGSDAELIHFGLTSSDIVDTSFALILQQAGLEIMKKLDLVILALFKKAEVYRGIICLGRTHGQGAEPTTFGIKLLGHCCELFRSRERLSKALALIACGKFSGAVGVYGHTDPDVESHALLALGLASETVATQIVARDRHAAVFTNLAILAGSIERLAVECRLLMHGQVKEVCEPFSNKQRGSSAMPHKKNPILSENLSGLMRLIRSYALAALENQALWHERDISHSSVERVIAPDAFHIMDFSLTRLHGLIENLVVNEENMKANLKPYHDVMASQAFMLALVKKGIKRSDAYEMVQKASLGKKSFRENLDNTPIKDHLSDEEIKILLKPQEQIPHEDLLFKRTENLLKPLL